jgi:hydroxyethylthiazole kinase-like uncharacterized protein yjeF
MNELLSAAQMAQADALAIAGGVPGMTLMEAAGGAVAEVAEKLGVDGPVLVAAGPGNNGGDGFVAARRLLAEGRHATVALFGDSSALMGDAAIARDRWPGAVIDATGAWPDAALVIDALFGTGLDRPIEGPAAAIIDRINGSGAKVLSVDLPSGLNADSGEVMGRAVAACATSTFFRKKPGHLLEPGRSLCGAVHLAQIGIPERVLHELPFKAWENTPALWTTHLRRPGPGDHKYTRGHVLVVSGPAQRTGAARLAAMAALRAGAGLVTLGSPSGALMTNAAHLTAVMLRRIDGADQLTDTLADRRFTCCALGPGLGTGDAERAMVLAALASPQAAVLDADALTAFAGDPAALFDAMGARGAPTFLTPHEGEFGRLFPELADRDKVARARAASARSGAIVVLKGPDTIIAASDGRVAINSNAPPWLATAGSGDTLTGILAGLAAQGLPGFEAAAAAVWMHGAAGTEAGPGLIAEDLAPALRPVVAGLHAGPSSGLAPPE